MSPVLFNYGSFDPFAAVDLGLTSQKRGRSPAMLRRERSISDQVQMQSILRLILPEIVAWNQIKLELQEKISALSPSPPPQKVQRQQFPCFAHSNHHYTTSSDSKAPSTPNCVVQAACGRFEVFCTTTLDYSIPLIWTVGSTSISIHVYVDLCRSLILYGKDSSIDLSSIDSNGIRSPCT